MEISDWLTLVGIVVAVSGSVVGVYAKMVHSVISGKIGEARERADSAKCLARENAARLSSLERRADVHETRREFFDEALRDIREVLNEIRRGSP